MSSNIFDVKHGEVVINTSEPNWGTCFSAHDPLFFKVTEENNIGPTGEPTATPSVCS